MNVKYAVIPCAGKGTRFLPITKGVAKEMCPIVDRPTLDYIVQECIDGGITDIIFVVSSGKDDIKKFYTRDEAYEKELILGGKEVYANQIKEICTKANYYYVIQEEQLGLGHAVLMAKDIVKDDNFVVCCGDDICIYEKSAPVKQIVDAFIKVDGHTIVGGQKVPHEQICRYGSMGIEREVDNRLYEINKIVEKPDLSKAPSDLASLGKRVFNSSIFEELEKTPRGKGGEIQLTDAIDLLREKEAVYFYDFEGKRYDCGDKLGYIEAIIDTALKRDDLKDGLIAHIKSLKLDWKCDNNR